MFAIFEAYPGPLPNMAKHGKFRSMIEPLNHSQGKRRIYPSLLDTVFVYPVSDREFGLPWLDRDAKPLRGCQNMRPEYRRFAAVASAMQKMQPKVGVPYMVLFSRDPKR